MGRKITTRLLLVGLCSILVTLVLCVFAFYTVFERQAARDMRISAAVIAAACEDMDRYDQLERYNADGQLRITLIRPDGAVLYDSEFSGALENHLDRPEVQEALEYGAGEDERESETASKSAYYYALRLENGDVLRISMDMNSRFDLFRSALPVIVICCAAVAVLAALLSLLFTRQLVRSIVRMGSRLDEIDREVPYPEMQPFVDAIVHDRAIRRENENMRQEFTANVAHELKTPLTSIMGYAEIVENGIVKAEDIAPFAGKIRAEARRLLTLIEDIIRLSQLDEGGDPAPFEPVELAALCGTVRDRLQHKAAERQCTLRVAGAPAEVSGQRRTLEQMVFNLADNAIAYNKPGGSVLLETGTQDGAPFVRVSDTGIGIAPADQQRVFERFYRVDKSHSKMTGGTGLGLSIVKHGAALHHAEIALQSTPGEGTAITLRFTQG